MKKIILSVLISVVAFATNAQDSIKKALNKPHNITINCGVSVPIGSFGGIGNISSDGFAKTGLNVNVEGAYFFNRFIGIGARLGYSTYSIDNDAINKTGTTNFADVNNLQYTFNDGYLSSHAMGGVYANFFITKKFAIGARVLAGLITINRPRYNIKYTSLDTRFPETNRKNLDEDIPAKTNFKVSGLAGITFKYFIEDRTSLNLDFEYSQTATDFSFELNNKIREIKPGMKFINVSFGWSFYL